jgi:two-component system CheB/CheR fusion protein
VIVTSSMSIEALTTMISTLPADFPAPVVLAQHLDHNRVSSLGALLRHRTNLRIEVVYGVMQLLPG